MNSQLSPVCCRHYPGRYELFRLVQANSQRYPFLLETTAKQDNPAAQTARYDILFCFPQATLCKSGLNKLEYDGAVCAQSRFLDSLDQHWRAEARQAQVEVSDLPFTGGWFVYLGYELAGEIEPCLDLPGSDSQLPVAQATRIPAAIIYDHLHDRTTILTEAGFSALLDPIEADLLSDTPLLSGLKKPACHDLIEDDAQTYLDQTRRVLDYIREGDVFQVNLSRQWQAELDSPEYAMALYQNLRRSNPAPFAGFAALGNGFVLSSSPERLVRVRGRCIDTRPIAGTRPRMQTAQGDVSIRKELIQHPKERAEHVMLIDLERNDLGRLCVPGSVQVDEMMVIESYAHVHHIVSNVSGELHDDMTPGQTIAAVFPGGTITGCPKVRCMEIIAELEQTARGPYTGSFGYLNHNGDMDLNILIRTMSIEGQQLRFRTGAGLVADSDPQSELAETRAKARGLLLAMEGDAGRGSH